MRDFFNYNGTIYVTSDDGVTCVPATGKTMKEYEKRVAEREAKAKAKAERERKAAEAYYCCKYDGLGKCKTHGYRMFEKAVRCFMWRTW